MPEFRWNPTKSRRLKRTRGVSFEEITQAKVIRIREHPGRAHQHLYLFEHKGYIWAVPFVETEEGVFLKTLYPSRKYTRLYRKGAL